MAVDKKWMYIGGGVVVVLILAFVANSYGLFGPGNADIDHNLDGTTTYTNNDGSVTVGQGTGMPENWPSDAPDIYSGATIMYSGSTNPATGASGASVVYTAKASVQNVIDYYSQRLTAEGWTIEASAQTSGIRVISAKKDTRTMGVYVADGGNGTASVTAGVEF